MVVMILFMIPLKTSLFQRRTHPRIKLKSKEFIKNSIFING